MPDVLPEAMSKEEFIEGLIAMLVSLMAASNIHTMQITHDHVKAILDKANFEMLSDHEGLTLLLEPMDLSVGILTNQIPGLTEEGFEGFSELN